MDFRGQRYSLIVTVLLALAAVEIVYLIVENGRLRAIIDDPKQYFAAVKPSTDVPALRGADIQGRPLNLSYGPDQPATLIFWFAPTCGVCEENVAYWNDLAVTNNSDSLRVIGMCASDPEEARAYVQEHGVAFTVIAATDDYIVDAYGGNLVPQTLLISPLGKVMESWPGTLQPSQKDAIAASLANVLSGLTMEGGES